MITTTEASVGEVLEVSDTLRLITLTVERARSWEPGMFLQLALDRIDRCRPWPDSRAFSIASWGSRDMRLLVRKEGAFTSNVFDLLHPGSRVTVRYPFGEYFLSGSGPKTFIAGGAGVSVFMSYIDYARSSKVLDSVDILHSVSRVQEALPRILHGAIPQGVRIRVKVTRGPSGGFSAGRVRLEDLPSVSDGRRKPAYFICGPSEFTRDIAELVRRTEAQDIRIENWKAQTSLAPVESRH